MLSHGWIACHWCIVVHTIVTSLDARCHICMMVSLQGFTIFGFETILFVLLLFNIGSI